MSAAPSKKIKPNRFTYTGQGGELFKMWLVNLLLTIPTLGIYRFWAKAKIRQYQAAHLHLDGSSFEHTGNGKELFVGFLKVMGIIFGILILFMVPEFLNLPAFVSVVLFAVTYVAVFYFLAVATYASIRYMASRTTWRGIRGHLGGSAIAYANFSIIRTLINFVTLGLKKPKSDILKHKFIMNNLQFGDQKFSFQGNSKGLMKPYLLQYMFVLVPFIIGILIGGVMKGNDMIEKARHGEDVAIEEYEESRSVDPLFQHVSFSGATTMHYKNGLVVPVQYNGDDDAPVEARELTEEEKAKIEAVLEDMSLEDISFPSGFFGAMGGTFAMFIVVLYIVLPIFGIVILAPYHTALARKKFGGLKLGDLRFKNTVSSFDFIKFVIGNMFILILTITAGKSIVWKRTMKFLCSHVIIGGDLKEFSTKQVALQKAAVGEGLGDAMDLDGGFDIGL